MYKRDYRHEHEIENAKKDRYEVKIKKDLSEQFREKLNKENRTCSEFLREQIEKYVNE